MTKEYKDTLNLPVTDFPMKANLSQNEPLRLERWNKKNIYETLRQTRKGQKKFILHDGPPYANGPIHLGHALNKILKDFIVKSQSLSGYDVPFVPGWDCHGLPIEINVEKKIGKPGKTVSAAEFRHACRAYATSQMNEQREAFKRLGVLADWQHPYLTMDFSFEANTIRALAQMVEKKYVRRGVKPVYWCVECASALAEAEVEYANKTSHAIDVRFRVQSPAEFAARCAMTLSHDAISIPIWTTTPWTLPANEAVALHAEISYALIELAQEYLLIAEALVPAVMQRYGVQEYRMVGVYKGSLFEGLFLHHPFYDKIVPVVLGEHVTTTEGTGAVHTAPAHGVEDYQMGVRYQLPIVCPVQSNGCYQESLPLLGGCFVRKADDAVITLLKNSNALLKEKIIEHSYPHCWRHKTPIIFRATPQWFVGMDATGLRSASLQAISDVNWLPEHGYARMKSMIENRPDWCLSRQRTWGVPMPFILHKETGELHPNTVDVMQRVADLVEKKGVDAWYEIELESLIPDAENYEQDYNILDVWFESGLTHACVLEQRPELSFPADVYLEGSDQHRGWFQSSLLTSMMLKQVPPYKTVVTHGFTIDEQGRKMSKSLGNVIEPQKVIQVHGADVLRLWVATTDYHGEMVLSEEILKRISEGYRRLRNTARFLLSNLSDFNPEKDLLPITELVELDRFAIARAKQVQEAIREAYDNYQFHIVYQLLSRFAVVDMGNFYLDIIKDRQYTVKASAHARRSSQTALYHIVQAMCRWLSPILSFTADEIWEYLPGKSSDSIHLETWYTALSPLPDNTQLTLADWQGFLQLRDSVNQQIESLRRDNKIGSALEAHVHLYAEGDWYQRLKTVGEELRFILITSEASVFPLQQAPSEAMMTDIADLRILIALSEHQKCERCWQHREEVGHSAEHPTICGRCIVNVAGEGEVRRYA